MPSRRPRPVQKLPGPHSVPIFTSGAKIPPPEIQFNSGWKRAARSSYRRNNWRIGKLPRPRPLSRISLWMLRNDRDEAEEITWAAPNLAISLGRPLSETETFYGSHETNETNTMPDGSKASRRGNSLQNPSGIPPATCASQAVSPSFVSCSADIFGNEISRNHGVKSPGHEQWLGPHYLHQRSIERSGQRPLRLSLATAGTT